jgi:hypothetical protein
MFGLISKREKELKRLGDTNAIKYGGDYAYWLGLSRNKDTWDSFLEYFEKCFEPEDWAEVAEAYDTFLIETYGQDSGGSSFKNWVRRDNESYGSNAESATFFRFAGNVEI